MRNNTTLTTGLIERTTGPAFLWDTRLPGFGCRLYESGKRTFIFQFRLRDGKQRRVTLGSITLDQARERATELYAAARKGADPVAQEQQEREIRTKRVQASNALALPKVVAEFTKRHLEGKQRSRSYVNDTRGIFRLHVLPRWQGRNLDTITRRDVIALLDAVKDQGTPVQANRTLAAVRKLFNWSVQRGLLDASPVTKIDPPSKEKRRERVLTADEVAAVWRAAGELGYPFGLWFRMCLATAQRCDGEVAKMRWADIDEGRKVWRMAGEQNKAGRAHVTPLAPLALDLLAQAPREGTYVFTTTRGAAPISGFSRAKKRIDGCLLGASHLGAFTICEGPQQPGWGMRGRRASSSARC